MTEVDRLLNDHTYGEIANILNERQLRPGRGERFNARIVARIQKCYALRPRYDRLRQAGLLTLDEMAGVLSVHPATVKSWAAHGLLQARAYTDKPEYLYEPPGRDRPIKAQGIKLSLRRPAASVLPECSKEVQYEA